jgi:hypothetical protein
MTAPDILAAHLYFCSRYMEIKLDTHIIAKSAQVLLSEISAISIALLFVEIIFGKDISFT